ncbi:MAG: Phosphoglucosamine mutase [Firmicutes bacterium ADurb.Bin356]|nr:MAG: Phosphoglucosamine mutase [Firmicutes bacterium ADurb.Bin356]
MLERILEKGYSFGGEQSGHIIFANEHTTGDGMLSAIKLLNVITHSGRRFSELADEIPICPQVLVNVIVDEQAKDAALNDKDLKEAACGAEAALGKSGRVLIRKSGTEPLIRIMLEGMDENDLRARAGALAHILITNHNGRLKG